MNYKKIFLVILCASTLSTTTETKAMDKKNTALFAISSLVTGVALGFFPKKPNDTQKLIKGIKIDTNTINFEKLGTFLAQAYGGNGKQSLIERTKQLEEYKKEVGQHLEKIKKQNQEQSKKEEKNWSLLFACTKKIEEFQEKFPNIMEQKFLSLSERISKAEQSIKKYDNNLLSLSAQLEKLDKRTNKRVNGLKIENSVLKKTFSKYKKITHLLMFKVARLNFKPSNKKSKKIGEFFKRKSDQFKSPSFPAKGQCCDGYYYWNSIVTKVDLEEEKESRKKNTPKHSRKRSLSAPPPLSQLQVNPFWVVL